MAIRTYGDEYLPAPLRQFQARDIWWLWGELQRRGAPVDQELAAIPARRDQHIAALIRESWTPHSLQLILEERQRMLLPKTDFDWIAAKDQRQLAWLFNRLNKAQILDFSVHYPPTVDDRTRLVAAVDLWETPLAAKRTWLSELRHNWSELRRQDKQLRWLDRTSDGQCRWAWEYLQQKGMAKLGASPLTTEDFYIATLSSFDLQDNWHPAARELFIEKMKKSWGQKRYRDQLQGKKQCNFLLSVEARQQLELLAQRYGKGISETVEYLIEKERALIHQGWEGV